VSDVHVAVAPHLHMRLYDTRRELEAMTDLARRLAEQLDAHVDEAYGGPKASTVLTGKALYEARQLGLIK